MNVRDPVKRNAASSQLKRAADDWADGKISADKRDATRASAKDAIKYAKRPTRLWDGDRKKEGLA
jgi:hypothetical protein